MTPDQAEAKATADLENGYMTGGPTAEVQAAYREAGDAAARIRARRLAPSFEQMLTDWTQQVPLASACACNGTLHPECGEPTCPVEGCDEPLYDKGTLCLVHGMVRG